MRLLVVLCVLSVALVVAQPPPGGGGGGGSSLSTGQATSTECTISSGSCNVAGTSNYINITGLSYDSSTGKFSGKIVTNQCPKNAYGKYNGTQGTAQGTASCISQTIPATTYTPPAVAPLRGAVGFSLNGVNIYGPFDAGFVDGFICTGGSCDSGTDVGMCENVLKYQCGSSYNAQFLLDDCGGHASPYHYHADLACDYTKGSGHSDIVGVALDGRGIYGLYESTNTVPNNLDACGGHFGDVPTRTINGKTIPAASNVYHYHLQTKAPFTLGCFGPVASLSACKAVYSTCSSTATGKNYFAGSSVGCYSNYDVDCPCFSQGSENYNQANASITTSAACGVTSSSSPAPPRSVFNVAVVLATMIASSLVLLVRL